MGRLFFVHTIFVNELKVSRTEVIQDIITTLKVRILPWYLSENEWFGFSENDDDAKMHQLIVETAYESYHLWYESIIIEKINNCDLTKTIENKMSYFITNQKIINL